MLAGLLLPPALLAAAVAAEVDAAALSAAAAAMTAAPSGLAGFLVPKPANALDINPAAAFDVFDSFAAAGPAAGAGFGCCCDVADEVSAETHIM